MTYKTIKAYPTIEVSKEGSFRHRAVKGFKGNEIVTIPSRDINTTSQYGKLLVSLPRIAKDGNPYFETESVASLMVNTFLKTGVALSQIGFKNGKSSDCSLTNLTIK